MATIRLRELTVRRGPATIVDRLDWTLSPGRVVWVVGPNGAGKSSLLRVLAGLDPPAAGSVERSGLARQRILHFDAETDLPRDATVADWDRLTRALLPPGPRGRRTALWPEDLAGRRGLGALSTGERKRLLLDPLLRQTGRVLLLDEPYEHLSPDGKAVLRTLLEARAEVDIVVVATNQLTGLAARDGGLRIAAGRAEPLPRSPS